jgi:hypothetical protein
MYVGIDKTWKDVMVLFNFLADYLPDKTIPDMYLAFINIVTDNIHDVP